MLHARRKSSSGDGVALSAAYAPVRPRRKRQGVHTAVADNGPLPQENTMFLATVAALAPPLQQRSSATSSKSILQKNRVIKPMASESTRFRLDRGQYDLEELGEREETSQRSSNAPAPPQDLPRKAKLLLQKSGACTQEKLAYDELLRYQRSRAEDMAKLYGLADERQENNQTTGKEHDAFRKAAGFREEWRIGREDEILGKLRADAELTSNNTAEVTNCVLREHFKRSIHLFLSTDLAKPPQSNESTTRSSSSVVVTKRSQDLLYAQQMDRVLSQIETQQPFAVMNDAVLDARARFQSLLVSRDSICWAYDQNQYEPAPVTVAEPRTAGSASSVQVYIQEPTVRPPELLQLYENVMNAKQVAAKATTTTAAKASSKLNSISAAVAVAMDSNPEFLADLQQQRAEAEHQQDEIQARAHLRLFSIRRVQRYFRGYRESERERRKAEALRRIATSRATRMLQLRLPTLYRAHRNLRLRRLTVLYKHTGMRIALCCFWKRVYCRRCGFVAFQFTRVVDEAMVRSVIRIQSFWRQARARRQTQHLRAFAALRARRAAAKDWRALREFGQHVKPFDIELVEWKCNIAIEKKRVRDELVREETRFASEWRKYETKLQKEVLKSKLPTEWIPQMDATSGETYFLNTKTVKSSRQHPNKSLFNQLATKQRARAEELYSGQISRLEGYQQHLDVQFRAQVHDSLDEILAAMVAGKLGI